MAGRKHKRNPIPKNGQLLMLLFADFQVVISNTTCNLQLAAYKLNNNRTLFNDICTEIKTDGM